MYVTAQIISNNLILKRVSKFQGSKYPFHKNIQTNLINEGRD